MAARKLNTIEDLSEMPPKTAAERQKKYREKLKQDNPEKYEERRLKHLEKVKENIKKKKMSLTKAEKQEQLKKWRKQNSDRAKKKKEEKGAKGHLKADNTSASHTDNNTERNIDKKTRLQRLIVQNMELRRKNSNLRRQNNRYKLEIINLKKKLIENNNSESAKIATAIGDETPITKTNNFLEATIPTASAEEKEKVKKKLLLLNTLTESIKINYEIADTKEKKNVLKNVATHEMVNKYKQKTNITKVLGLKGSIRFPKTRSTLRQKYGQELNVFFKREDVSRHSAGKKECVTKNKNKMQKRYLTEPLYKLHKKYQAEGGRASFQTFCRFRPFYVVHPKIQDRNTCACVKHTNMLFKTTALKRLGVLQSSDLGNILEEVTCSTSFRCFYSECMDCKDKIPALNSTIDANLPIQWLQWKIITHTYTKVTKGKCEEKKTKKYVKTTVKGTVGNLIKEFLKDLRQFKIHHYNVNHQYQSWKKCIKNLEDDEICLVCDFSENFACKQAEEIQAVHFGASRNQITLHTSVLYTKNKKPLSICTISPINEHGPGAIWVHLDPILQNCTKELKANKLHVFSDSPATQYRQKNNFYMFQKRCSDYEFQFGTWNFFEASHGKGPADGVGGAIKRQLDSQIAHGHDITNAKEAYDYLKDNTNIKIFYIPENKVEEMTKMIPNDVVPIKGTMKVHQIATTGYGPIKYKWLSCFDCETNTCCDCYYTKEHQLIKTNTLASTLINNKKNESHVKESKSNKKYSNKKIPKAQKRQSMQTGEVLAKKRKRSKSLTSSFTSISDDAMSIYSESDCTMDDIQDEEEDEEEVNTDNEHENTNKENKSGKVTILSSIRFTPENLKYVNLQTYDPFKLQKIDKNFNLSTVHNTKHKENDGSTYEWQEREESLKTKIKRETSKREENVVTKNDNEVAVQEIESISQKILMNEKNIKSKNYKETYLKKPLKEINIKNTNARETDDITDDEDTYLKKAMKETNIENTRGSETKDVKDYKDVYLKTAMQEITKKDNKIKSYRETEDNKNNEGIYLKTAMKETTENNTKNNNERETEDLNDNKDTYLKTPMKEKTEKCTKNNNERETEDLNDNKDTYLKTPMKQKSEKVTKSNNERETEDLNDNKGTYLKTAMKEKTENSTKNKEERETEDVKDNEGTYLKTKMKEKQIINKYDEHIKEIIEIAVEPSINEESIKKDVNIEAEDYQKNEIFKLGDTTLVRFYKKTWKYYVGVITKIHYEEKMYSISFYKSRGKNVDVKFLVPKTKDLDCIPEINIVKKIELVEKEGSLSLMNIEDAVYF